MSRLLSSHECAEMLSINRRTWLNWQGKPDIPHKIEIAKGLFRWKESDLEDFIEKKRGELNGT